MPSIVMWGCLPTALLLSSIKSSLVPIGSTSENDLTLSGRYILSKSGIEKRLKYLFVIVAAPSYTLRLMGIPLRVIGPGLATANSGLLSRAGRLLPGTSTVRAPINRGWNQSSTVLAVHLGYIPYYDLLR